MELTQLREHLDRVDSLLVTALAERMSFISLVSEYKMKNDIKQRHPQREEQILKEKKRLAQDLGLDEQFVEDLFILIFAHSHRLQRKHKEERALVAV